MVKCKECDKQYVGQTKRSLRLRTNNHRADIVNQRNTTVAIHFNTGRCSIEDFQIMPIYQCPLFDNDEQTTKYRLQIEQFFIEAFKCYLPYGLNMATKKYKDTPSIHFIAPYSGLSKSAARIIRTHYEHLQEKLPQTFPANLVSAYCRNKNLKDMLVSTRLRKPSNHYS